MDSFIFISDGSILLNRFCDKIPFHFSDGSLYYTQKNSGKYLNIHDFANAINEYDKSELDEIKKLIVDPKFYYVDTNSFDLLKNFAAFFKGNNKSIFDNDRGGLITINKILKMNSELEFFSISINS